MDLLVTIADTLDAADIRTNGSFAHAHVYDLRCENGKARAIEEPVLKRLRNHFISYDQTPMDIENTQTDEEMQLLDMVDQSKGNLLMLTDNVGQLASLCGKLGIEFTSKVFYVVETGKGDFIRPMTAVEAPLMAAAGN